MSNVKLSAGTAFIAKKNGQGRKEFATLQDALTEQSKCGPCGCDDCFGLITQINATTGELMGMYITGTGPYTLVIEPYDTALSNAKALKAARDAS